MHSKVVVGYAQLVTITTDDFLGSHEMRQGVGANWTFLHDPERTVQKDLDIQEYTDPNHDPMIPHTIVLRPGLEIYRIYMGYWFWGRPSTAELWQDLREITREIRADWQIDTPEMREKWERGEKDDFFPYGKPLSQVFSRQEGRTQREMREQE